MALFTMGNMWKKLNASKFMKHPNITLKDKKLDRKYIEIELLINKKRNNNNKNKNRNLERWCFARLI